MKKETLIAQSMYNKSLTVCLRHRDVSHRTDDTVNVESRRLLPLIDSTIYDKEGMCQGKNYFYDRISMMLGSKDAVRIIL